MVLDNAAPTCYALRFLLIVCEEKLDILILTCGSDVYSGIYVGSGVIEAGCKVIVGNRMRNAGMHWSKDNAEKMISLRCAIRNGIFLDSYLHDNTISGKSAV